jgi:hypothetical protein
MGFGWFFQALSQPIVPWWLISGVLLKALTSNKGSWEKTPNMSHCEREK